MKKLYLTIFFKIIENHDSFCKNLSTILIVMFLSACKVVFAQTETEPNNDCSTADLIAADGTYSGVLTSSDLDDYWFINLAGIPSGSISIRVDKPDFGGWQVQKLGPAGCVSPVGYQPGGPDDRYDFYETHVVTWNSSDNLTGLAIRLYDEIAILDANYQIIVSGVPQPSAPGGVSGANLWLDASDPDADGDLTNNPTDDTDITTWKDRSGYGNDVTTAGISQGGVNPPSYFNNQFNGKAALRFDKSNSEALGKILGTDYVGDFTIFMVLQGQTATPADFDAFFSSWNVPTNTNSFQIDYLQSSQNFQVRTTHGNVAFGPVNQELDLFTVRMENTTLGTYSDGVLQNQSDFGSGNALGFNAYRIGANRNADRFYDSKIAEVIIYPRALTDCEMEQVNDYLGAKYGRDYYNLASNFDNASSFPNDVTGIGAFASACSGNKTIDEGISSILIINNPSSNDTPNEFLTFAHDGKDLAESSINLPASLAGSKRIGRSWTADRDGDVGTVDVSFDLNGVFVTGSKASDFKLLINGDSNFATGTTTVVNADSYYDDKVRFTAVNLPDGAVFTLVTNAAVSGSAINANRVIVNPSFEFGSIVPHNDVAYPESQTGDNPQIDGWYSTHPEFQGAEGAIEHWRSGFQSTPSADGDYHVELNVAQPSRLYQAVYLVNGETFNWEYYHRKRIASQTETVEYSIYSEDGSSKLYTISTHTASGTGTWDQVNGTYTFTGPTGIYQIGFEATSPASGGSGNFLDNITIGLNAMAEFYRSSIAISKYNTGYQPHIILNGVVTGATTITFQADPGTTAIEGVDYNFAQKTITIPPGNYSAADSILIPIDILASASTNENRVLVLSVSGVTGDIEFLDSDGDGFNSTLTINILNETPGGVTGTNFWLKANEGVSPASGTLSDWTDQSGLNDFTVSGDPQTGASKINFNNVVDFDGSGDYLTGDQAITFQTLYAVAKLGTGSGQPTLMSSTLSNSNQAVNQGYIAKGNSLRTGNNSGSYFQSSGALGTEKARLSIVEIVAGQNAANQKSYIDGTNYPTQVLSTDGTFEPFAAIPYVGRSADNSAQDAYNGQIAELIMYPASHTAEERNKIQTYLAVKYGITLDPSVANYLSSDGTVIWNNTTYWNDVFGIGRDDASGLNQTQSNSINTGSGDGTGQSGKGNIVLGNASTLDNGDFLMVGHDNGALVEQLTDLPASESCFARLSREWKVAVTNDPGTVTLAFDLNGLTVGGSDVSDFKILIDSDGDGDFTSGASSVMASSFANNILTFDNLTLADGVVFTFITGTETIQPTIATSGPITVSSDAGVCTYASSQLTPPATSDNCGVASVVASPSSLVLGSNTVTWTVTDDSGNTATSTQIVTVEDNELPTIGTSSPLTVSSDSGVCTYASSQLTPPTTSDNCGVASVVASPSSLVLGSNTVTWTVTDDSGNTATSTQTVTIEDNELPTIGTLDPITVSSDAGVCTYASSQLTPPTTSDNCGVASVVASPTSLVLGPNTVTWTATDDSGNITTSTQTVTVEDNELPTIGTSSPITVSSDGGVCTYASSQLTPPTTIDNCGVASVIASPSSLVLGSNTVTWTVTDNSGNIATSTQEVTVEDNEQPTITTLGDLTFAANAGVCTYETSKLPQPTTDDNCGVATVEASPSVLVLGVNTVTWTVTDVSGNVNTVDQSVTIIDNEKPTIATLSDFTVDADTGVCTYDSSQLPPPVTSDNCGVASVAVSPSILNLGANTVTWTVTDDSGNKNTSIHIVTVQENELPTIATLGAITVHSDAGVCTYSSSQLPLPATSDNCGVASVVANPSELVLGLNIVTWTVTDDSGNTRNSIQEVTVVDNEDPTIGTLNAISVNTDVGECTYDMSQLPPPATSDNCGIASTVASPSVLSLGLNTVTWTVTDDSGNTKSSIQEITVVDNVAPIVSCPSNQTVHPDPGNLYTLPDYFGTSEAMAVDNCTNPLTILTQSPSPGTQLGDDVHTITFTAQDASGNIGACSFDLIVDSTRSLDVNIEVLNSIKLYPNPTSSIVKIQNLSNIKLSRLTIYDMMGRVINSIDLQQMGEEKEIDLSPFESAVYLFEIHSEQGKLVKSVVKQ